MTRVIARIHTALEEDLPFGWRLATIEEIVGPEGVFVDGDWVESKDQDPNGDVRLIQLADVGDAEYRNKSERFLTHEKALALGCTFLQKEDVLIARMPDPLGRACVFPGDRKKCVTVVDVAIVRSGRNEFNHRWLMYFINAPGFRSSVASLQSGSTRKRISRGNLARIALPVPPREQQNRIVAEIEKESSRLDEAVASLNRTKANLKRYKAAVLKAAVEGKLTEQWRKAHPGVEPASKLLERILDERKERWSVKGNLKQPGVPDISNVPQVPAEWTWVSLDQISSHITSGSRDWSQFYGKGTGTFVLAQNVRPMRLDFTDRQRVDPPKGDAETERTRLQADDLLVTIVGAKTGDVCRVSTEVKEHFVCQSVALLRPVRRSCVKFVELYLASPENGQLQWRRYMYGQGRPHLSFEQLRMTAVPLPPQDEQDKIVAEVERRLSVIDELEATVEANLTRADRLRQAILTQAFSGKLSSIDAMEKGQRNADIHMAGA